MCKSIKGSRMRGEQSTVGHLCVYGHLFLLLFNSEIYIIYIYFCHFSPCQVDVVPGTKSIFGLKRTVKSNCQAALFDGVVSLTHLSVREKDCCQSQIRELRRADLHDISLSGRAEKSDEHSSTLILNLQGMFAK